MNLGIVAVIIIGGIWICSLFFGFITGTGKVFKKNPASMSAQATEIKDQQQQLVEDSQSKQQEMMDKIRDKISNNRRD